MNGGYVWIEQLRCYQSVFLRHCRLHPVHKILLQALPVQMVRVEAVEVLVMWTDRPEPDQVTRASRHRVLMAPEIIRTDSVKVTLAGGLLNQE